MRCRICLFAIAGLFLLGWATAQDPSPPEKPQEELVFDGLGTYFRTVTTNNALAQKYFNQGLNFLFAFNHDEAIRAFEYAAKLDPNCAMAQWGIAYANGPHINFPMVPPERAKAAWIALGKAKELVTSGAEVERGLVSALEKRYADPQPEDRKPLDLAFSDAMRQLWKKFPQDPDIGALFAESLMNLTPWNLWTVDGKPRPETPEIVETLETVMKQSPRQPLAMHLYIHAMEASPTPEKADEAAERLRFASLGLGHMAHMPSHIDIRRGRWQVAIESNQRAIGADDNYRMKRPKQGFYAIYMAHNHHMLAFAAIMQGESKRALSEIRTLLAAIPQEWLAKSENRLFIDGMFAVPTEVLMRFGRWDEVLQEPMPDEKFPVARAMAHFARGCALAAQGKVDPARAEQKVFREAATKPVPEAILGNNKAADIFAIADLMLEGEILLREEKNAEGLAKLREAIAKEDQLRYDEPPDWLIPVRHALGAFLLKLKQPAEAEQVYREDLKKWPENGFGLFGLAQSLKAQGKMKEAAEVQERFDKIWQRADVKLTSSCFCQEGN